MGTCLMVGRRRPFVCVVCRYGRGPRPPRLVRAYSSALGHSQPVDNGANLRPHERARIPDPAQQKTSSSAPAASPAGAGAPPMLPHERAAQNRMLRLQAEREARPQPPPPRPPPPAPWVSAQGPFSPQREQAAQRRPHSATDMERAPPPARGESLFRKIPRESPLKLNTIGRTMAAPIAYPHEGAAQSTTTARVASVSPNGLSSMPVGSWTPKPSPQRPPQATSPTIAKPTTWQGILAASRKLDQASAPTSSPPNLGTPVAQQGPPLLPHERAAQERLTAAAQSGHAPPASGSSPPMLPHERVAWERAKAAAAASAAAAAARSTVTAPTQQARQPLDDRVSRLRIGAAQPRPGQQNNEETQPRPPCSEWGNLVSRGRFGSKVGSSEGQATDFWAQAASRLAKTSAASREVEKRDVFAELQQQSNQTATATSTPNFSASWDWVDTYQSQGKAAKVYRPGPQGDKDAHAKPSPKYLASVDDDESAWYHRKKFEKPSKPSKPKAQRSIRSQALDLDEEDYDVEAAERREARQREKAERRAAKEREKQLALEQEREAAGPPRMYLPEFISVSNLGSALGVKQAQFLGELEELGFEDIDGESIMTGETAALVAQEYGFEPVVEAGEGEDLKPRPPAEDKSLLPVRPPVVTIMGHVDHGKTTLLDHLRQSSVAAQEHGGITQHIGAFSVKLSGGKQITFLDTPGHAAFLSMRQRGANVTDIVILVVAADDSVKPQTIEALRHARAAKVPIVVAINKIDKDKAQVDQVKWDLAQHDVEMEENGGDVQVVLVSGKTGQGMRDLEDSVALLAEMLDLRAETDGMSEGWVLESTVKPIGRVATVLVKRGTLRKGDFIVAGKTWTKIRTLRNEAGVDVDEATPGTAVEVLGWKDAPDAGDMMLQAPDEATAKAAVGYREEQQEREKDVEEGIRAEQARREKEKEEAEEARAKEAEAAGREAAAEAKEGSGTKTVNFTVKADVHGSVEALCASIMELGNNEVRPRVLWASAGQINESDVEHSATAGAVIINFSNAIPVGIRRMAEKAGVKIVDHNVIYHVVDDVKDMLSAHLKPKIIHRVVGEAEVLQVFRYNIRGRVYKNVAGCKVRNGQVSRTVKYRVVRNGGRILEDATLESLKKVKQDVETMRKGSECGMSFRDWDDFKVGDQIQAYEVIEEARRL